MGGGQDPLGERALARLLLPRDIETDLRLERLDGREAMNEPFEIAVCALSRDSALDLESLLGRPVGVAIERPQRLEADRRHLHGLVARIEQAGTSGRYHRYTLTLRPWLWFLSRTRDCRIFQELTTPEILAKVFEDHAAIARHESRLTRAYPKRRYCVQYRETDLAFVSRLLEEDGIGYHFEHRADGHTLVLTDPGSERAAVPGLASLPYHQADERALGVHEVVSLWQLSREVRPGSVVFADFDFKKPNVTVGGRLADPRAHEQSDAEDFDYPGRFYNDAANEGEVGDGANLGDARARVALERHEVTHFEHAGRTNARGLATGCVFALSGAPRADQNREYLVIATQFKLSATAYEGGGIDPQAAEAAEQDAAYDCRFRVLPTATGYRPAILVPKPRIGGPQTATVVGPTDEEIHTDVHGRVKLRFHWDRNPAAATDENLTAWVRVSEPWAGKTWGGTFLPRVGQEVLVDFLEGDPDRPVVTGRMFNAAQRPTAFSATGSLPGNKALAGLRSKEYRGDGYNELVFDDTTGELRTKLSSEAGKTQLNLGYLVHPRDTQADGAGGARGEGFELRTDQWGALRAAKGLFLSTDGRHRAVGGSLDRNELVACLEEALKLAKGLADQAADNNADRAEAAPREALGEAVRHWGTGSNAEADGQGQGGKPIIALSAPGGIAIGTPGNLTAASGANTDLVAQKHQQLASGLQTHVHAGTGVRIFAHSGGVKVIANKGRLLAQAQHDDIVANAEKNIDVTATSGHVLVQAEQHVTLVESGGAYIKLSGGAIELGCPGAFTVKAASYNFVGPASGKTVLPTFAASDVGRAFQAMWKGSDQPAADVSFKIDAEDGTRIEGQTDGDGRTPKIEQSTYEVFGFVHTPEVEE